jgi:hypothetical protein
MLYVYLVWVGWHAQLVTICNMHCCFAGLVYSFDSDNNVASVRDLVAIILASVIVAFLSLFSLTLSQSLLVSSQSADDGQEEGSS